MKKVTASLGAIMTILALSSPLYAAGEHKDAAAGQNREWQSGGSSMTDLDKQVQLGKVQSAQDLLGLPVVSQRGDEIGEIQDIKLDTSSGKVSYLIIQKGGVLGIGGEEGIAAPLEAFEFTNENARLTVDQAKLENVPQQANMSDQEFQRGLESHYGISPGWQEGPENPSQQMNLNRPNRPTQPDQPQLDKTQQLETDQSRPRTQQ